MARVIEPIHEGIKITEAIEELLKEPMATLKPRVCIVFWHGLGDLLMFLNPYFKLKVSYPQIDFTLAVQRGLGFEEIVPFAWFIDGEDLKSMASKPYDLVALVHFPMSEGQTKYTKGEWSCVHELGIEPQNGHFSLTNTPNKLVGVHFNITCLPEAANPSEEIAKAVWDDILVAGYTPVETHFEHVFHNPVNKKFDFVNNHVRGWEPRISSLIWFISHLRAFIGVVSGNFHVALATLDCSRIFLLEKHLKLECFTHLPVARASIKDGEYAGEVRKWLEKLE